MKNVTMNRITRKQFACTNCGWSGLPKVVTRGNIAIEILLWLLFLIPGMLYSIWRQASKYLACPSCGNKNIIPADSVVGQNMISKTVK